MVRFIVIAVFVVVLWLLLLKLFREVRTSSVDWRGVVAILGFIALAIYLHYMTGVGGIAG